MMRFTRFLLLLAIILLYGCATTTSELTSELIVASPEEQVYLDKVNAFSLKFIISKSEEKDAWGRAHSFITQFSSMKLKTVTEFVIRTYNPTVMYVKFGYYVTKTPLEGDVIQVNVRCNTGNVFASGVAKTNAHILAYYIKTGELTHERLITK